MLRYLENAEPAASRVADLFASKRPGMSWINLGEVHYVLRRAHGEADAVETVRDLRDVIDVRLPDERLVLDAARLKADHPMAYADAFGAALAIHEDATLWIGIGEPELLVDGSRWRWQDLRRPNEDTVVLPRDSRSTPGVPAALVVADHSNLSAPPLDLRLCPQPITQGRSPAA